MSVLRSWIDLLFFLRNCHILFAKPLIKRKLQRKSLGGITCNSPVEVNEDMTIIHQLRIFPLGSVICSCFKRDIAM